MLFFDMILKVSKAGSNVYIVPEYQVCYDLKSGTMDDGSVIETTTGNIQDVQLTASLLAEKETNFTLFPNPGSDFIEIKSKDSEAQLVVFYDINGQVKKIVNMVEDGRIEIFGLTTGIYLVKAKK